MSRILCAAALSAIGLFIFATTVRAANPPASNAPPATQTQAANPTTTHGDVSADHAAGAANNESGMRPWRASETLGLKVENPQGQNLGKIEDIVFNPADGHIRYAVLSFGGFLGVGQKWFAVPWKHLRAETKAGSTSNENFVLVLDVDKTKLKNAPGFDSKRWPDFGNPAYGTSVDEFYGENTTAAHHTTTTNTK